MDEDGFIINAARLNLSEENISILNKITQERVDWDLLEQKACFHGVDTIIYYSLKKHNLSHLIPINTFRHFQRNFYRNAVRNIVFIEEIDRLSEIIQDKIVLLKGTDLMQSLYPNIAIRIMCDIDILVKNEKAYDIQNLLQLNGYCYNDIYPSKSRIHEKIHVQHLPGLYNNRCCIEIHFNNIFQKYSPPNLTDWAWEKAIPIDKEKNIYRLSNEYLLVHLCSHFFSHRNNGTPLRMLCDINELLCKYSTVLNWKTVEYLCENQIMKERVSVTLNYVHLFFYTSVPTCFLHKQIFAAKKVNLDSLLEVPSTLNENSLITSYTGLNHLTYKEKLIYLFRTFFPLRKWMVVSYNIKNGLDLPCAYWKYWVCLFRRFILKQNIQYAN
jgi:hypothetical protein